MDVKLTNSSAIARGSILIGMLILVFMAPNIAFTPLTPSHGSISNLAGSSADPPTLNLSPVTGVVGLSITVGGVGYAASTTYTLCFSVGSSYCSGSTQPVKTNSTGGIPIGTTITVPQVVGGGYFVDILSGSTVPAFAAFSVTSVISSISPVFGPVATSITVSGTNLQSSTTYTLCFSTSSTSCSGATQVVTSTAGGAIPAATTVAVPPVVGGGYFVNILPFGGGSALASNLFSVVPQILSLTPSTGPVATSITVSGSHYAPSTTYTLCFSVGSSYCSGSTQPVTTDSSGNIPSGTTVIVPQVPGGGYFVNLLAGSTVLAYAGFGVTPVILAISPNIGPEGTSITVTGSNLQPSTTYILCFSTSSSSCSGAVTQPVTTTAGGTIPAATTMTVLPVVSGTYYIGIALFGTTSTIASALFAVTPVIMAISPSSAAVSTPVTITVTGSGFAPSTSFTLCFSVGSSYCSGSTQSVTTDSSGNIPGGTTIATTTGASPATDYVNILTGSTVLDYAPFSVGGSSPPTLVLSPTNGPVASSITVSGSNYAASTTYTLCFSTAYYACSGVTQVVTTTAGGAIPAATTMIVPQVVGGGYFVDILSGSTVLAFAAFSVTPVILSLSPVFGPIATSIAVSGSNLKPSTTYTLCFSTSSTSCPASVQAVTTNSGGNLPGGTTVIVPEVVGGTYYVDIVPFGASNVLASETFTVTTAIMSLSPIIGPIGTSVTVTGSNFAPSTTYTLCFSTVYYACSGTTQVVTTTAGGAIPPATTVTVPQVIGGGYFVEILTGSTVLAFAAFSVTPVTFSATPNLGPIGTTITVGGSGLSPSKVYTLCFTTSSTSCGSATQTVTADSGGNIPSGTTLLVPEVVSGTYYLDIFPYGASNILASFEFSVTPETLSLSPNTGVIGTPITVSGSNYAASTAYTLCFSTVYYACSGGTSQPITTDSGGNIPSGTTITVPPSAYGQDFVLVLTGSTVLTYAPFGVAIGITLNPTSGTPGTSVTVSGSGFAPSETITIKYDGVAVSTTPSTVTSSSSTPSTFTATFTVPAGTPGSHTVAASDTSSNSASQTFTLVTVTTSTTTVTTTSPTTTTITSTSTVTSTSPTTITETITSTTTLSTVTSTTTVTTPTTVTSTTTTTTTSTQTSTQTSTATVTSTSTVTTTTTSLGGSSPDLLTIGGTAGITLLLVLAALYFAGYLGGKKSGG